MELSLWQRLQYFCIAAGLASLAGSHVGLTRERERQSDLVTFGLWWGGLLATVPLLGAVVYYRISGPGVSLANELGLVTAATILLVTGCIFRIKSTALVGGSLLMTHLTLLIVSVGYAAQLAVGVYLAAGGGLLFACGIVLSIWRDRLLKLPERFARREGVFRVMGWR